ncbi:MAG: hypothetical protein ACHREM_04160 [Polyangiales bacterium]
MLLRPGPMLLGLAALVGIVAVASSASASTGGAANAGPPDLSVRFHNGAQITAWFRARGWSGFVGWFNTSQAHRGAWGGVAISADDAAFEAIWNNADLIYGSGGVSLAEVLVLSAIMINETGGQFRPISEYTDGVAGHPGLAYPFDAIPELHKRSYNAAPWTAGRCFNDPYFIAAHGSKAMGEQLAHSSDPVWNGETYPQDRYPTSTDPSQTGFIMETDFFKFRGRGLIQTTFRAHYLPLIQWIQNYAGGCPVLQAYRQRWAGQALDTVACQSSNDDWDVLFMQTGNELACAAIRAHNMGSGLYLFVASDPTTLLGSTGARSAYNAGYRVSGGRNYAATFQKRVAQMVAGL